MLHKDSLEEFLEWMKKAGYKPGSIATYRSVLSSFLDIPDVMKKLSDSKLAPKTRHTHFSVLRSYADWSKDEILLDQLKGFRRRLPSARRKTPRPPLSPKHLVAVRESLNFDKPVDLVIGLMATRGFRVGDVVRLRREEVETGVVTKTLSYEAKKGQRLEWGTGLFWEPLETLWNLAEAGDPWEQVADVIAKGDDAETRRVNARWQVEHRCKQIGEQLGIPLYPHRLRRTIALNYLEAVSGDITKLMKWMGWQNIATAYTYVDHVDRGELEDFEDKMK